MSDCRPLGFGVDPEQLVSAQASSNFTAAVVKMCVTLNVLSAAGLAEASIV